eukprot:Hpha_TRINITY_DN15848_c4_g19::TRINITY_DN15848_c4_g19_i1::g.189047::m.189047
MVNSSGELLQSSPAAALAALVAAALAVAVARPALAEATTTTTTGRGGNLAEEGVDGLVSLLKHAQEAPGHARVLGGEEGVGVTDVTRTTSATDTVDVVLHALGEVVVDHSRQPTDVETTLGDVGGDEDRGLGTAEDGKRVVTLLLRLVTVDGQRADALRLQEVGEAVDTVLGLHEDKDLVDRALQLAQQVEQLLLLVVLLHEPDVLTHVRVRRHVTVPDVELHPVTEEVLRQGAHLLRPRRGEHERLTVRAHLRHDAPDLGLETHVKHTVGLVKHTEGRATQVRHAGLEEVDHAPRGRRDDHGPAQLADLGATRVSTVHRSRVVTSALSHLLGLLLDLHAKLAGGGEEHGDRAVHALLGSLAEDVHHGGDGEGEGLAGPCLGDTHEVVPGHGDGPGLGLDRGGLDEALLAEEVLDVVRQLGLREGQDRVRRGNTGAANVHHDTRGLAPRVNVLRLAVDRGLGRLVGVLLHL